MFCVEIKQKLPDDEDLSPSSGLDVPRTLEAYGRTDRCSFQALDCSNMAIVRRWMPDAGMGVFTVLASAGLPTVVDVPTCDTFSCTLAAPTDRTNYLPV